MGTDFFVGGGGSLVVVPEPVGTLFGSFIFMLASEKS